MLLDLKIPSQAAMENKCCRQLDWKERKHSRQLTCMADARNGTHCPPSRGLRTPDGCATPGAYARGLHVGKPLKGTLGLGDAEL